MPRKRSKEAMPVAPPPVEVPVPERDALIAAYQAGLIQMWKHEGERGYRLTSPGGQDDYVEVAKLEKYLERLGDGR